MLEINTSTIFKFESRDYSRRPEAVDFKQNLYGLLPRTPHDKCTAWTRAEIEPDKVKLNQTRNHMKKVESEIND